MMRQLGRPWAFRRVLGMSGFGGIRWLLRDEFTTDLAAGSVNGTAAEPGPGTRTVTDTGMQVSTSGGKLVFGNVTTPGDPRLYYSGTISRSAGRMLFFHVAQWANVKGHVGLVLNPALASSIHIAAGLSDLSGQARMTVNGVQIGLPPGAFPSAFAAIVRQSGYLLFKVEGGKWILLWIGSDGTTNPLYVGQGGRLTPMSSETDCFRVPADLWLPTPLVSDGFGSAFGTTDGLGHAEGIAGGIGAGGSGLAWSNVGPTWSASGGKAVNTAPSGLVQQISVANLSCADVYAGVAMTRALLTNVGLALNFDSASSPANGVLVYTDGGSINVDKCVAGVWSSVSTTAYTYSAGARLVVWHSGTEYRTYYNNLLVKSDTIADAGILTGTYHGLFSTDVSNTLDDLTIYATGTSGEYSTLNAWSA